MPWVPADYRPAPWPGDSTAKQPSPETSEHDLNPLCAHLLRYRCQGCGTCTLCDGCYCDEE